MGDLGSLNILKGEPEQEYFGGETRDLWALRRVNEEVFIFMMVH